MNRRIFYESNPLIKNHVGAPWKTFNFIRWQNKQLRTALKDILSAKDTTISDENRKKAESALKYRRLTEEQEKDIFEA